MLGNRRILKTGIIFAFLGLIGSVLNFYSSVWMGDMPFVNGHIIDMVLIILAIVGGLYFFKVYLNQGFLHLWQGIALGFWILLVCINFISLFQYLYLEYINPSLLDQYKEYMVHDFDLKKPELIKEGIFEEASKKLEGFKRASSVDVVIHQIFLKFLPFPITIFSVFFASLALRKVEK